jgi:hypothetical protein
LLSICLNKNNIKSILIFNKLKNKIMAGKFKFTFGPWNIHEGADPFGPTVRKSVTFNNKLTLYKNLGFDGVQFHDDDAVPDMNDLTPQQVIKKAKDLKKVLDNHGLTAEFVAPRLWEDKRTIDGGFTSNDSGCRMYAIDRSRACDRHCELRLEQICWSYGLHGKELISVKLKTAW